MRTTYLVLSINGGGFKGFACLLVLVHLMAEISDEDDKNSSTPRPWFNLIRGTSTRGLIPILLGRFGLSCWEGIEVYKEVGATMSGGEADSRNIWKRIIEECQLSSAMFERKLEDVIEKYTGRKGALFGPLKSAPDTVAHESTKTRQTFVTVVSKIGTAGVDAYRIRSYPRPLCDIGPAPYGHKWTIFKGARGTMICSSTLSIPTRYSKWPCNVYVPRRRVLGVQQFCQDCYRQDWENVQLRRSYHAC
ncbi:hypothetical protein HD554DRAFT_1527788 [Boletus coccyginus]|nr:hypothetical protein HD554DRAFT_1527788 [Boletus coccyginus]